MNHHPDIDIRWNKVTLVLSTHSEGGLTAHDFELAHRINEAAGQKAELFEGLRRRTDADKIAIAVATVVRPGPVLVEAIGGSGPYEARWEGCDPPRVGMIPLLGGHLSLRMRH